MDEIYGAGAYEFLQPPDGRYGRIIFLSKSPIDQKFTCDIVLPTLSNEIIFLFSKGRLDQGSWNGMIGEALNGNVDIIAADLTITSERAKVLEFTVPFMSAYTTIISRKPERRGNRHGYGGRHRVS